MLVTDCFCPKTTIEVEPPSIHNYTLKVMMTDIHWYSYTGCQTSIKIILMWVISIEIYLD